MDESSLTTQCCIAGGGPAGMMLGFLLARAGVDTVVLEKWPDFFRDFRGDTIHPSTMELMFELNLLNEFLKLPHNVSKQLSAKIANEEVILADFSKLNTHCPYLAFMPQWDFLNFLANQAKKLPSFKLLMQTEATDVIWENNRVAGVIATNNNKQYSLHADLVIAADGRHSTLREKTNLSVESLSAPMDVLWFRLSRIASDDKQSFGRIDRGSMMVMIARGDYWQCGYLIRKGGYAEIKNKGLEAFRHNIVMLIPSMQERVNELVSWEQIKLLTVVVDRLQQWYLPGLLCIGDSAHAMSPIGGVGINLAVQDAVATANLLIPKLLKRTVTVHDLKKVQMRRQFPVRLIQRMQITIQRRVIDAVLGNDKPFKLPLIIKLLKWFPILRRVPAYLIGMGIRRERIKHF